MKKRMSSWFVNWNQKRKQLGNWYLVINMILLLVGVGGIGLCYYESKVPNTFYLIAGEKSTFDLSLPAMTGNIDAKNEKSISFDQPFTLSCNVPETYSMDVKLFGVVPFKKVDVAVKNREQVVAGGEPVGIYVETDGVMVLGTAPVIDERGQRQNPANNIIVKGDYIIAANDVAVHYKSDLIKVIEHCGGADITFTIRRNGNVFKVKVRPVKSRKQTYQCGIWVRDDTQGIGTITYKNENGRFGALGHGITDVDTGKLMETVKGRIYEAKIAYITKGTAGHPGELAGSIDYANRHLMGSIIGNSDCGIYGQGNAALNTYTKDDPVLVALPQEIHTGDAVIQSYVSGKKEQYTIEIEQVNLGDNSTPDLTIRVTDSRLLDLTGGIVQGMSGSPIIQDGKLVGAVTHVFVKDPTRGYAIFIEEMLEDN